MRIVSLFGSGKENTQELNVAESEDEEKHDEDSRTAGDDAEDDGINDPLTRTDVKVLRASFGSRPSSEESTRSTGS